MLGEENDDPEIAGAIHPAEDEAGSSEEDDDFLDDDEEDDIDERAKPNGRKRKEAGGTHKKPSGRSKRARTGRSFLDVEAAVGDDEEEEYGDDEDYLHEAEEAERLGGQMRRHRPGLLPPTFAGADERRTGGATYLESTIGNLERRFQGQTFSEEDDPDSFFVDDEGEGGGIGYGVGGMDYDDPARFLPEDLENARLWLVRVTRDSVEREVVIAIMNKALKMRQAKQDFPILSAFAADNVKDHIYVEAENPGKVVEALSSFRNIILSRNIKMVPPRDLRSVFQMGDKEKQICAQGSWVRIKSGLHEGDLGQVVEHDSQTGIVTVRVVPRVDFNEALERAKERRRQNTSSSAKFGPGSGKRPPPRFFSIEEIESRGGEIEPGPTRGTVKFAGKIYEESGYQLRKVRAHMLLVGDDARLTRQEIMEFQAGRQQGGEELTETALAQYAPQKDAYKIGDTVVVRDGDLAGLIGKVLGVNARSLNIQTTGAGRQVTADIPLKDVMKHFEVGASVTVVSGSRQGDSGLVTGINAAKRIATVFSPSLGRPFTVPIEDLSTSANFTPNRSNIQHLGGFGVGDLIQLGTNQETGVIIRIDAAKTFSVLTSAGVIQTVQLSNIATKRSSDFSTTIDANRNILSVRCPVILLEDPQRGQSGRVLHIWRQRVFVKLANITENGGVVVTDGRRLKNTAASSNLSTANANSLAPRNAGMREDFTGGRGGGFRGGGRGGGYSRQVQRVKIISGLHKTSLGDVRSVDDASGEVRVTLVKNGNTVTVSKRDVIFMAANSQASGQRGYSSFQGSNSGGSGGGSSRPTWSSYFGMQS